MQSKKKALSLWIHTYEFFLLLILLADFKIFLPIGSITVLGVTISSSIFVRYKYLCVLNIDLRAHARSHIMQ